MTLRQAIDHWLADMWAEGRVTSKTTDVAYRHILECHAQDVNNRSPHTTNRADCIRTLRRWPNPNTMVKRRSVLISFYRWAVREGIREANPAEQTPAPRSKPTGKYRLTRGEVADILRAANGTRERRAIYIGLCAGLRSYEERHLRGRHFARPGFIWVSPDIGKGGRERWVPVIAELELVVAEIRQHVAEDEHVLPGSKAGGGGWGTGTYWREDPQRAMSSQTLQRIVKRVAKRAGIAAHVHPHLMRHAFTDHIARMTGDVAVAQALVGHADIATTQIYMGQVSLDELADSVRGLRFTGPPDDTDHGTTNRGEAAARYGQRTPPPTTWDGEGGIRTLDSDPADRSRDGPHDDHRAPRRTP